MSHFTVLVTGSNIEEQMEPFNEVPTENNTKYFEFNSIEEDSLKEYEEELTEAILVDGNYYSIVDEKFKNPNYRINLFSDNEQNPRFLYPNNVEIEQVSFKKMYPTFESFMEDWHGSMKRDPTQNKYGYFRNPNAKWDWWVIGGRWRGFFKSKSNIINVGKAGVFDNERIYDADQLLKGDIDFDYMTNNSKIKAELQYAEIMLHVESQPHPKSWNFFYEKYEYNKARTLYNEQPVVPILQELRYFDISPFILGNSWKESRELYIQYMVDNTATPYAILHDGVWRAKGDMGWFGVSHDTDHALPWHVNVKNLINDLPDDTMLTLIDCHI